MLDFCVNFIVL